MGLGGRCQGACGPNKWVLWFQGCPNQDAIFSEKSVENEPLRVCCLRELSESDSDRAFTAYKAHRIEPG